MGPRARPLFVFDWPISVVLEAALLGKRERERMTAVDQNQQKMVNEAAEKFAGAIKESYKALADRSVSAQELNAQLTQEFFNGVIDNLRTQAESNRALADDLIE